MKRNDKNFSKKPQWWIEVCPLYNKKHVDWMMSHSISDMIYTGPKNKGILTGIKVPEVSA